MQTMEQAFQFKMSLMEKKYEENRVRIDALHNELATLKQEKFQQHEENKKLTDELAGLKARIQGKANNGDKHDLFDNENVNGINYDTKNSNSEKDDEEEGKEEDNVTAIMQQTTNHHQSAQAYFSQLQHIC